MRFPFAKVVLDYTDVATTITQVDTFIEHKKAAKIYFLNAHCYNTAATHANYREALHRATLVLPDGVGVLSACKLLGLPHRENLNGTDLIPDLCCELVQRRGKLRVFLLGGRPGVAAAAGCKLAASYPGVEIVGSQHGYFPPKQTDAVINEINRLAPDIVLVAMGVPLQELWVERYASYMQSHVGAIFAVGALLDFLAERVSRAPVLVRKLGLEWSWRLAQEPFRLAHRYLVGNPSFVVRILDAKLVQHGKPTPLNVIDTTPSAMPTDAAVLPLLLQQTDWQNSQVSIVKTNPYSTNNSSSSADGVLLLERD
jgi:exopolysaccharide biosynthesis WecB/TagA/CpsF family protein